MASTLLSWFNSITQNKWTASYWKIAVSGCPYCWGVNIVPHHSCVSPAGDFCCPSLHHILIFVIYLQWDKIHQNSYTKISMCIQIWLFSWDTSLIQPYQENDSSVYRFEGEWNQQLWFCRWIMSMLKLPVNKNFTGTLHFFTEVNGEEASHTGDVWLTIWIWGVIFNPIYDIF